jgi:hypothetical protein
MVQSTPDEMEGMKSLKSYHSDPKSGEPVTRNSDEKKEGYEE